MHFNCKLDKLYIDNVKHLKYMIYFIYQCILAVIYIIILGDDFNEKK